MKFMKTIISVIMYILFIITMGCDVIGISTPGILVVLLFTIFIIYNILNYKHYKTIFKGKYTKRTIIVLIVNILLLISMIYIIIRVINNQIIFFNF